MHKRNHSRADSKILTSYAGSTRAYGYRIANSIGNKMTKLQIISVELNRTFIVFRVKELSNKRELVSSKISNKSVFSSFDDEYIVYYTCTRN